MGLCHRRLRVNVKRCGARLSVRLSDFEVFWRCWIIRCFSEPEPQILDYVTQQHKLLIAVASSHAYKLTANWLWNLYTTVSKDLAGGKDDKLPEVLLCYKVYCIQLW